MYFGEKSSETTRMLGIFNGREKDTQERLKRGRQAVWKVRKRLMRTKLSKKTQAAIVETVVKSSVLLFFLYQLKITTKYFILCCPWRRKTQSHQASTKDSTYSFHKY